MWKKVVITIGAFLVAILSFFGIKTYNGVSFDVTPERMVRDLEGKTANLPFGQLWPFDLTQSLTVTVISKKQSDEFVVVAVELRAVAKTNPEKDKKSPSKVTLSGVAKLTYEYIGGWYLVSVDGISLRLSPLPD